ncbi:MAG TPA: hypothetical protein VJ044_13110, partial [Candidatus Hodarchaeales archaeon]|nr:hypothetical protein [Candidatus Hodarchaeales archaeon]
GFRTGVDGSYRHYVEGRILFASYEPQINGLQVIVLKNYSDLRRFEERLTRSRDPRDQPLFRSITEEFLDYHDEKALKARSTREPTISEQLQEYLKNIPKFFGFSLSWQCS